MQPKKRHIEIVNNIPSQDPIICGNYETPSQTSLSVYLTLAGSVSPIPEIFQGFLFLQVPSSQGGVFSPCVCGGSFTAMGWGCPSEESL
jgi:hypothetical protein